MTSVQEEVRRTAQQLLSEGKADLVIGFADGTMAMKATPCFISEAESAQKLVGTRTA